MYIVSLLGSLINMLLGQIEKKKKLQKVRILFHHNYEWLYVRK